MPLFQVPVMSGSQYHEGSGVAVGDTVVPVLLVVDSNDKASMVRGDPVTIQDFEAPANLAAVTVALGTNDPATEITFSNLNAIADNVGVTGISVLYNTTDDSGTAASESATVGVDTYTVTGLTASTLYYCWTAASDAAGNTAGPTPVTGGSITTDAQQGPTSLAIGPYYDSGFTQLATLPAALAGAGTQLLRGSGVQLTAAGLTLRVSTVFSSLAGMNQMFVFALPGDVYFGFQIYQPTSSFRMWVNGSIVNTYALGSSYGSTTQQFSYIVRLDVANQQVHGDVVDNNGVVQISHTESATLTAGSTFTSREGADPARTVHAFDVYDESVADVTSL